MYQEDLGKLTADHLRSHISAYLDEVNAKYTKPATLVVPKTIEYASVVGGAIKDFDRILPAYGIDVLNIAASTDATSLWTHEYIGQINGIVSANSREAVDILINRHSQAVEMFVQRHFILHDVHPTPLSDHFRIVGFVFGGIDFSGAEELGIVNDREVWLAGFSMNVSWFLSQDGPDDHG